MSAINFIFIVECITALRAQFMMECVEDLRTNLMKRGLNLLVKHGKPEEIIPSLARTFEAHSVKSPFITQLTQMIKINGSLVFGIYSHHLLLLQREKKM